MPRTVEQIQFAPRMPQPLRVAAYARVSSGKDSLPVACDEKLWHGTIDHVTVHADERVVFMFKDGKEIVTRL